ncbi:MAG TPA: hypothetical protein GXZ66_11685 [Clostridiaceae bacterium]|jgi:hypothetical protein|nr:hypothetical protein [Clostridiaceae bacterium]
MRYWCNKKEDDGSIHAIGNGRFIVYGRGPNIHQMQGPPYSVPFYGGFEVSEPDRTIETKSERASRDSKWIHNIYEDGEHIGTFTDCMDPEYNVFVRSFEGDKSIRIKPNLFQHTRVHYYKDYDFGDGGRKDCLMLAIGDGTMFFMYYALQEEIRMYVIWDGNVRYLEEDHSLVFEGGKGKVAFISAVPGEIEKHFKFYFSGADIEKRSRGFFDEYLKKGDKTLSLVPQGHPEEKRIKDVLESVAVLTKCQTARTGGILAGHFYPMAYVRDMAGTMRSLIKSGYVEEGKNVLEYWYRKWKIFGTVVNADSMGHDRDRLFFPNDEVEVPAYIVYCAMYYYNATKDKEFLLKIFDMVKWAFGVQLPHLVKGMTSFSGDETYIAGWVFPRSFLYHGSAESTLLFIEGGRRFIEFAKEEGLLDDKELANFEGAVDEARNLYKENFVIDGVIHGNNPEREKGFEKPRFHKGFCDVDLLKQRGAPYTWLELGEHDYYRCPNCLNEEIEEVHDPNKRYILGSTGLLPVYYDSDLFNKEEIRKNVDFFARLFEEKGYIPSHAEGTRSLGYDFGLLLYNLAYLDDPLKEEVLKVMLDIVDGTGAWVEYYDNKVPFNCRCRPWESGINIEALIYYLEKLQQGE